MAAGQFAAYIKSVSEVNLLQIDYTFMNIKGVQWTSLQLLFLQKYKKYCLVLKLFIIYQFSMRNFGNFHAHFSFLFFFFFSKYQFVNTHIYHIMKRKPWKYYCPKLLFLLIFQKFDCYANTAKTKWPAAGLKI